MTSGSHERDGKASRHAREERGLIISNGSFLLSRKTKWDHGKIFFDGRLDEVLDRLADFKRVNIQCKAGASFSAASLGEYGELVEHSPASVKLKVKRDRAVRLKEKL